MYAREINVRSGQKYPSGTKRQVFAESGRICAFLGPILIIEVPFWFEGLWLVEVVSVVINAPYFSSMSGEAMGRSDYNLQMFVKTMESFGI